jgi:hypothetical protein
MDCSTCTSETTYPACSASGSAYSAAGAGEQCNVYALTQHTTAECSSEIKPMPPLNAQGCFAGAKIECGGNSASAAASFAAVALVAILSVVA